MKLPPLTIIPAGAGSGKTYTIQKTLADWVTSGQVRPDRIVAVTFTEAAAAEMRDRIRAELTAQGRLEDALRLEQSYISTIHGFGLRVLTEFAFDCGISPSPRLLNEDEEGTLMRRALAQTDRVDEVMDDLEGFGYRYDFSSGKGAEDLFREAVLKLISKLRSIGRVQEDYQLLPNAEQLIRDLYGDTGDSALLETELHQAVVKLLQKYPTDLTEQYADPDNASAVKSLRQNYRDLKQAEAQEPLSRDWHLWQRLRKLRTTGMPGDYTALADEVALAADRLPHHPGPLEDALKHVRSLLGGSQDALGLHGEKKRENGLLDYTDMLALTHSLFTDDPATLSLLKERIDCLIIDEFQDTNPLQFSLLWHFQQLGVPTLIVGDLKQAIMGFQNADSRLLEELMKLYPDLCRPLESNWRSTPALMNWINLVGSGLFAERYTPLKARADFPSVMTPLEAILFSKRPKKLYIQPRETAIRIRDLLQSKNEQVYDRAIGSQRLLRGGDIALLAPTNLRLERYAEALRNQGIRVRIAQSGWFESRIVQLCYYALAFVADPEDLHAALYLSVTELGELSLETALKQLLEGELPNDAVLVTLQPLREAPPDIAVSCFLLSVIDALSLYDRIMYWPDADQARANLLRLQHEARQFQDADPEALAGGGFYGYGLKSFLAWLKALAENEEQNVQPEPNVLDADAVELVTWHRSKGREWPVVVVAGLEASVAPRLPGFDVVYENFNDLATILEHARIEILPEFAAPETKQRFIERLEEENRTGALRLLYVALTRVREKLILEWPQFLATSKAKAPTYWSLLTSQTAMTLSGATLRTAGESFACRVVEADLSEESEPYAVMPVSGDGLRAYGRRALCTEILADLLTPDSLSPSQLHDEQAVPIKRLLVSSYHQPQPIASALEPMARGTLLHRAFELGLQREISREQAIVLLDYPFAEGEWNALKASIYAFRTWLQEQFSPVTTAVELPLLYMNEQGTVVSGIMDLLVETKDGFWIIDHKSDLSDNLETRFSSYLPQLLCYAEAVQKAEQLKPVLGVAVNWTAFGKTMLHYL